MDTSGQGGNRVGSGGHTGKGLEEAVETEKEEAVLAMQLQAFFQKKLQAKGHEEAPCGPHQAVT